MIGKRLMRWNQAAVFLAVGALVGCGAGQEPVERKAPASGNPEIAMPGTGAAVRASSADSAAREDGTMTLKEHRSGTWSPGLTEAEKTALFQIAKDTLEWSVNRGVGAFSFDKYAVTPKLKEKCATFVTFKNEGELRGCMGCLEAMEPMYMSVHRSASNASRDFRFVFNPIRPSELEKMDIHVSLLSPRRKIASIDEFKIGEHGICIEKGGHGAVYLPEVAVEQGWTREETLSQLSLKAGLSADAWREGTEFKVYESVVLTR